MPGRAWACLSFLPTIHTPNQTSPGLAATSSVLVAEGLLRDGVELGGARRSDTPREVGWAAGKGWGSLAGKSLLATQFTNPTSCLFVCLSR